MEAKFRHFAIATLCAALGAGPALAADPAPSACKPLSNLNKRLVERADQGVDALRTYVYITRGIYQLNMDEVADSLEGWRANAGCVRQQKVAAATMPQQE
jgi:hypothetical protein